MATKLTIETLRDWYDGQTVCPPCLIGNSGGLSEWSIDCVAALTIGAEPPDPAEYVSTRRQSNRHLFYIEASDADGVHAFIVSADSDSAVKAEELARASVLDSDELGTDAEPGGIDHCHRIGATDADVFEHHGLLAS